MNMKHLYTSLGSGATSGSVTDNSITDDSVIEIYFDNTDCYIDSSSQSGHTVYFTVGGNATGTNVCVVVNNLTNFTPYDDTNIVNRVSSLESEVETLDNVVTTLETDVETLETRVDGLNANNINYDEHSTLYSAMGDIDSLETTSKNLVGAINEVKESGGGGGQFNSVSVTDIFEALNGATITPSRSFAYSNGNFVFGSIFFKTTTALTTQQVYLKFKDAYAPKNFPTSGSGFVGSSGNEWSLKNSLYTYIGTSSGSYVIRFEGTGNYALMSFNFII